MDHILKKDTFIRYFIVFFLLLGLSLTSLYSYLLFHVLAEFISIIVAGVIFVLAWNTRKFQKNDFFLFLGTAFLFVGVLDLFHTLAYGGMNIFPHSADLATRFWIAARSLEAAALLVAPLFLGISGWEKKIFASCALVTVAFVLAIGTGLFPACYLDGVGLTSFKVVVECLISFTLVLACAHFWARRDMFDRSVFNLFLAAIVITILSEISFTLYSDVYDSFNMLGHLLKILAFVLISMAIIETGIQRPYDLIFRDLTETEALMRAERDRAQKYLDIAGVIILALDRNGLITLINREGERFLGRAEDEVLGLNWFAIFVPDAEKERVCRAFHEAMEGKSGFEVNENSVLSPDGVVRQILWRNVVLADDDGIPAGVLSSGTDITDERLAKDALTQANRKIALLSSITRHDTLNHLTALSGYLDLALTESSGETGTFLGRAKEMSVAIEKDLRFGSEYQDMGTLPPVWQDPAGLIRLCGISLPACVSLEIELDGIEVYADPMFKKVFCNLIGNAVNHAGNFSRMHFSTAMKDENLIIVCEDDGVGISQKDKEKIFTRGYGRNHGYGLFLIREILGITGILITETGEPGNGARFEISVPPGRYRRR